MIRQEVSSGFNDWDERFSFKGTNIRSVLQPGVNFSSLKSATTWSIIKFQIYRILLKLLYRIFELRLFIPETLRKVLIHDVLYTWNTEGSFSLMLIIQRIIVRLSRPSQDIAIKDAKEKLGDTELPNCIMTVLEYEPHNSIGVPPRPVPVQLSNGMVLPPTTDAIRRYEEVAYVDERKRIGHETEQREKLINDASNLISWCADLSIRKLVIYEETGMLIHYLDTIVRNIERRFRKSEPSHTPLIRIRTMIQDTAVIITRTAVDIEELGPVSKPASSVEGLDVVLLSRTDPKAKYAEAAIASAFKVHIGSVETASDLDDDKISSDIINSLVGISEIPDLMILFGDTTGSNYFPLYALKNAYL